MLDLRPSAVTDWLLAIQPARTDQDWPPPIRPIESAADALFDELSDALGLHHDDDGRQLAEALADPATAALLRSVLAQLGAARMLRLVAALFDLLPHPDDAATLHRELRDRRTPDGRALAASLNATARVTARPDRRTGPPRSARARPRR